MNIFLVHPDYNESAKQLAKADPIRARKQLVECCQLLAHFGKMYKADGTEYKLAHPNHPIVHHMRLSFHNYLMCWAVAWHLAPRFPTHASAKSFDNYFRLVSREKFTDDKRLIACRKGQPQIYVQTLEEYAAIMRDYCIQVKGMSL